MNKRTLAVASAALLTFAGGAYAVASSSAPTAITSSVTDKLGDAITAKYPGSTIVGIRSEAGGGYEVEVRKSDATEVHVTLDANYKITGEHTGGRGGKGGPGGDRGGHGGHRGPHFDTAALAKAIGVTETKLTAALDKLRAAHQAEHDKDRAQGTTPPSKTDRDDRRDEFAKQLAKELDVDASKVTKALEAQKPGDRP
jgi:hypothetical protein